MHFQQKHKISFKTEEERHITILLFVYLHYHEKTVVTVDSDYFLDAAFTDIKGKPPVENNITLLETPAMQQGDVLYDALDILEDISEESSIEEFWVVVSEQMKKLDEAFLPEVQKIVLTSWRKHIKSLKHPKAKDLLVTLSSIQPDSDPSYFLQILHSVVTFWVFHFKSDLPITNQQQITETYQHLVLVHLFAEAARVVRLIALRRYTPKKPCVPSLVVTTNPNPPLYKDDKDIWEEI